MGLRHPSAEVPRNPTRTRFSSRSGNAIHMDHGTIHIGGGTIVFPSDAERAPRNAAHFAADTVLLATNTGFSTADTDRVPASTGFFVTNTDHFLTETDLF